MNIVMVGPFGLRPKGTMAVRALPLACALVARGAHVRMVLPPWNCPEDSGKSSSAGGVEISNISLPPRIPGLAHILITWRLLRAAFAGKPDVIHCFKPKAYAGLVAWAVWLARCLRLTRVRLVVDSDDWEGKGGWNDVERYSRLQKAFFSWQERWGLTHNDALTVASRTLQEMAWNLGVPQERVFYIPNGAVSSGAGLGQRSAAAQPTVLLYTRFFEFAAERAVGIICGVLEAVPGARAVVVGAGLFGEEKAFMAQIEAAGLVERVVYAGWQEPAALPAYFAAADVAIYPFDDTLINRAKCAVKLIDLLSAGVPVVADRVGQNAEYIEDGVTGILVEPGDTPQFVAAVVRLLQDGSLRQSLSEQAQRRMCAQFGWELLATRVEGAYQ
jgi:glycosyltransferase involved in cell wall biosynthesis